jgi:L-cysteine:1D-myo-inositol 2-amino-2-deoxy-alpha-D-glucopyranoside ligase
MAELAAQRGGDPSRPGKKDPLDCLVWLAERPGEPSWDSPFGPGRPGWHVECAAIATEYLGAVFDVQAGGVDLVFPHHEMSASHARVALAPVENAFARVYAHAGMVSYQGEKMSKSLGNLVFVSRLLADGVDPMAIRMSLLAHHYRSDWEWTDAVLGDGQARLSRWRAALARAEAARPEAARPHSAADSAPGPVAAEGEFGGPEGEFGGPEGEFGGREAEFGAPGSGPASEAVNVLAGVRARLRDDLDAPGALSIVDRWADSLLAKAPWITPQDVLGARLVKETVDARLGVTL